MRTIFKGSKRVIAFDLALLGELQFFEGVLTEYAQRFPSDVILIVHHSTQPDDFGSLLPSLSNRVLHITDHALRSGQIRNIDMFITSEQYSLGVDGVYSICLFHGQPSKGLTFTKHILSSFDAFFLYGPFHKQALTAYLNRVGGTPPPHLELFDIGYPKSDRVIAGTYSRDLILAELGLDLERYTVVYAPAFNEHASLREHGLEIITALVRSSKYNVIVKLPVDCSQPVTNYYATGGIDWYDEIRKLEVPSQYFRFYEGDNINAIIACADVLVTCVSSVSFEFFAVGKPVIFFDTPKFFTNYLKKRLPGEITEDLMNDPTVNAGREYGSVVKDVPELLETLESVLCSIDTFAPDRESMQKLLLYSPGKATGAAVSKIDELLTSKAQSARQFYKPGIIDRLTSKMRGLLAQRVDNLFRRFGYVLTRAGKGYLDAGSTVAAAAAAGLSVCDYLEGREESRLKQGRRDRIIAKLTELDIFLNCRNICEIGAGTGMYLEKVVNLCRPAAYDVYETAPDWRNYLKNTYGSNTLVSFRFHFADGRTLGQTASDTCDLVHAHAVFVYLPLIQTMEYIREAARLLKTGGTLVFDCFLDETFDHDALASWLVSGWQFPVIIPKKLLLSFADEQRLHLLHSFSAPYGASSVDYLVFQKCECPKQGNYALSPGTTMFFSKG